jgi:2-polyprenyl-3-methyl-5-hydroxy-6-metoxy-1,4-benzoquinol methylase
VEEPFLSQFIQLVRAGVATRDIHDSAGVGGYDREATSRSSNAFVDREVARVAMHSRSLCPTLVDHIGSAGRILDVGCSTGGTTVALALSALGAQKVVGIDANESVLEAARVRALGHRLPAERVRFVHVPAGQPFGFDPDSFDLVTCVSVLEFITTEESRQQLLTEILRVVRPGGHVFLATPSAFRLREYHSRRLLGNWRHRPGYPWSSRPGSVRRMLAGCDMIPLSKYRMQRTKPLQKFSWAGPVIQWTFPWQQFLARKR